VGRGPERERAEPAGGLLGGEFTVKWDILPGRVGGILRSLENEDPPIIRDAEETLVFPITRPGMPNALTRLGVVGVRRLSSPHSLPRALLIDGFGDIEFLKTSIQGDESDQVPGIDGGKDRWIKIGGRITIVFAPLAHIIV